MSTQRPKRKRLDVVQNVLISLLSVSAVLLFARTQLYTLTSEDRWLGGPSVSGDAFVPLESADLSAPVRVAVSGDGAYGRYGDLTLTTADEEFAPLKTFLQEALGSARTFTVCGADDFYAALSCPSIYYDFLESLPLSILAELTDALISEDSVSARQLVISVTAQDTVQLTLWDGKDTYLQCGTAIKADDLRASVNYYELGNAYFAFDYVESAPYYDQVASCSLFLTTLPTLPVLTASDVPADSSAVLTRLGFNPNTNYRYPESNGTEVIVEGDRSLRISPDGSIRYTGSGTGELTIEASGEIPTLPEAAASVSALLNSLLSGQSGKASLYLLDIQQTGRTTTLRFDYQADGIPIQFSDGAAAAEVQLSGTSVASLSLRFRQYTDSGESSLLLPQKQAAAIAALQPGKELFLGYTDSGGASASAGWLLE